MATSHDIGAGDAPGDIDCSTYASSLTSEFEDWQGTTSGDSIFLLECTVGDGRHVLMQLLIGNEYEFTLQCPPDYPDNIDDFKVTRTADGSLKQWAEALNEYCSHGSEVTLTEILNQAVSLYAATAKRVHTSSMSEGDMSLEEDEEEEEEHPDVHIYDESAFTTEWELMVARKKKCWSLKEQQMREELKKATMLGPASNDLTLQATGQEKDQAKQIFTSKAASGILTNDLIHIMEQTQVVQFMAEPIDDNIYQWSVQLFNFEPESDLEQDLQAVREQFGYSYIELQIDFAIDLYPFYPPLVKVIRPRLQGSMMQRVTNMEMLKLSYWNPTKHMFSVLADIKAFLQQWARLEVNSERNDLRRYPHGSYVDIEHHLLRLALVSEVSPRANRRYVAEVEKPLDNTKPLQPPQNKKKKHEEYWAAGVGYGHSRRPEWDMNSYLAAQREKDKQIESVLQKILHQLKKLYAKHAPQLKPRNIKTEPDTPEESIDPVEDMYNILEGSALIACVETYFKADSFLEICRHTNVYKVIVDIVKEIAMQPKLLPLLGRLPDQEQSVYDLLKCLDDKACMLLQHICKAGNGSIPKPPKKTPPSGSSKKNRDKMCSHDLWLLNPSDGHASSIQQTAEEKLAREFQVLFKDVTDAFTRQGLAATEEEAPTELAPPPQDAHIMEITITTNQMEVLESKYLKALKPLLFDSHDIPTEGPGAHHYASEYKKQPTPNQAQVLRIAQDITSLSSSLPIGLSSSIFVRTDDEKITLMRALITGPEGTPYSNGCYLFDIFFPSGYPKVPPLVNMQTTGGGTVRFNPNLYNCGKVCLSLLGTWEGQQGEQWNETTSTVLQVLVSIQSLILVPEPYFNEPGYEQEIGTDAGKRHSAEYNSDVKINNIKYAMIAQLQNPIPDLEEVIRTHFFVKRDKILEECECWLRTNKSSKLERAVQNLKSELLKLQAPPNVANLSDSTADTPGSEDV